MTGLEHLLDELADAVADRVIAKMAVAEMTAPTEEPWRMLSVEEVADRLGRSPRWVYQAVKSRGLPCVHLDERGGLAFELEAVREWAQGRRVPGARP